MIGCYDFCGHYDWTFAWLERAGGKAIVRQYWDEAIHQDSQRHALDLIRSEGFAGMLKYWGHTLAEESPERAYTITPAPEVFRSDMHSCPSKGFLLRNGIEFSRDYCDHCMGWVGPLLRQCGYVMDHEHNHQGQCWAEIRPAGDPTPPSAPGGLSGGNDVRLNPNWLAGAAHLDRYRAATDPDAKLP